MKKKKTEEVNFLLKVDEPRHTRAQFWTQSLQKVDLAIFGRSDGATWQLPTRRSDRGEDQHISTPSRREGALHCTVSSFDFNLNLNLDCIQTVSTYSRPVSDESFDMPNKSQC